MTFLNSFFLVLVTGGYIYLQKLAVPISVDDLLNNTTEVKLAYGSFIAASAALLLYLAGYVLTARKFIVSNSLVIIAASGAYILFKELPVPNSYSQFVESSNEVKIAFGSIFIAALSLVLAAINQAYGTDPFGRTKELLDKFSVQEGKRNIKVDDWINTYNKLHDDDATGLDQRNSAYTTLVNAYYELATLFYEWYINITPPP
jgi:hypothetical protein